MTQTGSRRMVDAPLSRRRLLQIGATGLSASLLPGVGIARWGDGGGVKSKHIGKREYLLQLPVKRARPAGPLPLPVLMLFHGGGGKARGFARYSGFMDLCDQLGFIGVYPQGVDGHWYDARYRTVHPAPPGVDDVAFVGQLLDRIAANPLADSRRVYAMGMSNGGIFCQQLGLQMAERLAAVASVCGQLPAPLEAQFRPRSALSVLLMNGTTDPIVPYRGGEVGMARRWGRHKGEKKASGRVISTERNARLWVRHDGLAKQAQVTDLPNRAVGDGCRVQRLQWGPNATGVSVELYRIDGGGHTIPGRPQYLPKKLIGNVCRDINGPQVIWDFFKHQRLTT